MSDETTSWHLDKRVPVVLIVTLLVQFAAVVWAFSSAFKDIEVNRDALVKAEVRLSFVERNLGSQAVQLGRIEEQISSVQRTLNRLIETTNRRRE